MIAAALPDQANHFSHRQTVHEAALEVVRDLLAKIRRSSQTTLTEQFTGWFQDQLRTGTVQVIEDKTGMHNHRVGIGFPSDAPDGLATIVALYVRHDVDRGDGVALGTSAGCVWFAI